jgi:CRP-like cAMP-binding protein
MTQLDLLRASRLFSDCDDQELARLEGIASHREFPDGEVILSHGIEAQELLVIASGEIQLQLPVSILGVSKSIAFETKRRGEVVGWSALVHPYRFTLAARANGQVDVMALPRAGLLPLFESDSGLGFRVMRNLASLVGERLRCTQEMWTREIQRSLDEHYR